MLDARRMEVYSAIYNSNLELYRKIKAEILTEESYASILKTNKVYFIGSGVEKTKDLIRHPNAIYIEGKLPSANQMAVLSELKYKKSDTEDVAYFEPYYLKDFIALKKKA
jgi:tRNA threonylcarbamoyladenosine biosynthesis protein TsaB